MKRAAALLGACAWLAGCGGGDPQPPAADGKATGGKQAQATAAPSQGSWSGLIGLSLVPAAAANLPDGKLLL